MEIVRVVDEIIVEIVDTDSIETLNQEDGWVITNPLPTVNSVTTGSHIQMYADNWVMKPLKHLYELGFLDIDDELKVDDDNHIIPKTSYDLYLEGIYKLGELEYPNHETREILDGSLEDILESGVISATEYDALVESRLEDWRNETIVSKFQARVALYQMNMLASVESYMESADPIAQMAWQDAQEFRRYSPTMNGIAKELGLTEEQLDDLFKLGQTIEV